MTSARIRMKLGNLTQKEFAEKYEIPLGTVKNWDARDCMPEYIQNLIFTSIEDANDRMYEKYINSVNRMYEII